MPLPSKITFRWQVAQAAEWRWWQQYLKTKPKDVYLAWKRAYWQQLLDKIQPPLGLPPQAAVLDAGCGPAGIFLALDASYQITALDPLLDKYAATLPHFVPDDYPNTRFVCQTLEAWHEANGYDAVFCMNAINHVADIQQCFDNLISAARPNASIVVTIDAHNYSLCKRVFRALPGDVLHPCQYDLAEYLQMLSSRGVEIIQILALKREFFFTHYLLCGKKIGK